MRLTFFFLFSEAISLKSLPYSTEEDQIVKASKGFSELFAALADGSHKVVRKVKLARREKEQARYDAMRKEEQAMIQEENEEVTTFIAA